MMENHKEWRAHNSVDEIEFTAPMMPIRGFEFFPDQNVESASPELQTIFELNGLSLHKHTRAGQPLVIFPIGNSDAKMTATRSSKQAIEGLAVLAAEFFGRVLFPELERRTGSRVSSVAAIMDLGALGLRQFYAPALFLFTGMITLFEENYPESLAMVCVINAPSVL